jgi:hypothetical protein
LSGVSDRAHQRAHECGLAGAVAADEARTSRAIPIPSNSALPLAVAFALLRTDFGEGFGDCCDERFDGSCGDLSQQGFEFSEELFDGG